MTRASDTARLLGAGATILDGTTISTADNTTQLTLTSTDADATNGPNLDLIRDSSSPADGDNLGRVRFYADNDANESTIFTQIYAGIEDASDGTEDGHLKINTIVAGTGRNRLSIIPSETVFNEDSVDVDFRVESNNLANMFFIDGGGDRIYIGRDVSDGLFSSKLQIESNSSDAGLSIHRNGGNPYLNMSASATSNFGDDTLVSDNDPLGTIYWSGADGTDRSSGAAYIAGFVDGTPGSNDMPGRLVFATTADGGTSPTERFRLDSTGRLLFGTTVTSITGQSGLTVQEGGSGNTIGLTTCSQLGGVALIANRNSDDGTVVIIRQDNSNEGTISVSGNTVSYNAFSGSHWSRLTDNSKPTILKGTVIETIDEMCDWYQVQFTIPSKTEKQNSIDNEGNEKIIDVTIPEIIIKESITLPNGKKEGDIISYTYEGETYDNAVIIKEGDNKHTKCKISDTADSKRVYGVHADWDNDDDTVNDMYVTAVGTHVVRINKDVTVTAGDLLSSNGDGTAKVQDDDIIRSKTIGKVLTNIKQETYSDGSYTVPCALYCG